MYEGKAQGYFSHCRMDLLGAIPKGRGNRILEIGAGNGNTLVQAKHLGLATEVMGVELVRLENSSQGHPAIDRFIIGDIEKIELPVARDYFDAILCGDVLEHLVDPWSTIGRLCRHLKPEGYFIASIPNVREIRTLLSIVLGGNFRYCDAGILDRTHLRFFCKRDMVGLFEQNGLHLVSITSNLDILGKGKRVVLNKATLGVFAQFLESEYLLVSRK